MLPSALSCELCGLGARWGPTDPGAASCTSGFGRPPRGVRVAKAQSRSRPGEGSSLPGASVG